MKSPQLLKHRPWADAMALFTGTFAMLRGVWVYPQNGPEVSEGSLQPLQLLAGRSGWWRSSPRRAALRPVGSRAAPRTVAGSPGAPIQAAPAPEGRGG